MQIDESLAALTRTALVLTGLCCSAACALAQGAEPEPAEAPLAERSLEAAPFRRVASFAVFENTDVELETVAEIVTCARGGRLLIYTDSVGERLGFVDISEPRKPRAAGSLKLDGEPTSVAAAGDFALVVVNTSVDHAKPSGQLDVVDLDTQEIVATLDLGGQPDSVAVNRSLRYAAVAIENERDEHLGDGAPPQAPPGYVVIVDMLGAPAAWTMRRVDLVGVPTLFPEDPEPEFVDINAADLALVTLQENNHLVLIDLADGVVTADFSAGTVELTGVDVVENGLIEQTGTLAALAREPDGVAWTSPTTFATADEGDLRGGSRGFTTWDMHGTPLFDAGPALERAAARLGHYPEGRSASKGCEPEAIEFGQYGSQRFLFVGAERCGLVFVYELLPNPLLGNANPILRQVLPSGVAPEGLLAIPERDLFVAAAEVDDRAGKLRSTIMIYERTGQSTYPTIVSADRLEPGLPIPWGALSGLVADPALEDVLYTVHDGRYARNRILRMDVSQTPAVIDAEVELRDPEGLVRAALQGLQAQLPGIGDFRPDAIVREDGSLNIDPEAIAVLLEDGARSFWIASEGGGQLLDGVSDPDEHPFESPNMLLRVRSAPDFATESRSGSALVEQVVLPPLSLTSNQSRFGFEGVAVVGDVLYVAFQRPWSDAGDPPGLARIGRYDTSTGAWTFAHYPLEAPSSPAGGWVGLSELSYLGQDSFAVLERDNQGGPDARLKLVTSFSIEGLTFRDEARVEDFDVLTKTLRADLLASGAYEPGGGPVLEKQEGLAVLPDGTALIVNDNDGADGNGGETRLLRIEGLFDLAKASGPDAAAARVPSASSGPATGCAAPEAQELAAIPFVAALGDGGESALAVFEVDGDDLVAVHYSDEEVAAGALELWREIVLRIPTNQRLDLVQFRIFGGSGTAGRVDNSGTGSRMGRFGYELALNRSNLESNPADPCAPLLRRRGNFDWTLIHEFGHLRSYLDGSLEEYTRIFPGNTGPVDADAGDDYPGDGSPRLDGEWVTSYAERAGGDEDFAESFTTYVMLDELPTEDSLAADKVRWFETVAGYPELRKALRVTEPDGSTAALRAAPRAEFPLLIEPAAWMVGSWRGLADAGVEVEYHISSDDIVRICFEDGVESERLRYSALRDGGRLATVELYEQSESFYLHQVSIAGSAFSESFRRQADALFVESERLGDFALAPLER